ncbi:hypothetical protein SSX86_019938 [Deinandra increscens subsp. villosa]|uniref:Kinesin motor domain-containing protein n=1 Tax=Deinandra increscens subsp. villosa TaxID=3103831 RepID=A0AAP0CTR2_9ASTR
MLSRTFYLSMFEIYSERGKGEKIMDLSQEGGDLYMQQSNIKGLKEEVIHDAQHAESLVASGMLKRSTAMTNSNIQSSRSQCIINIRCDLDNLDEDQSCTAILTIVDLAGAEREKRTGNQGTRLLESNFINNTSMVFGLCLRSLLEHQKNPKKPLHKHFQNSMLTRYLRDFLEGKKRMSLILTAKPGEEDYQDTSYLLRQASPFMNIKFESVEEQPLGNKRRTQTLAKADLAKRVKLNSSEACMDDEVKGDILHQPQKEAIFTALKADLLVCTELNSEPDKEVKPTGSSQLPVIISMKANKNQSTKGSITDQAKKARDYQILSNFSRALWNVLKEYKNKLEASENEADFLRHNLTAEKERSAALEAELQLMKASYSSGKVPMAEEIDEIHVCNSHDLGAVTTSVTLLPVCSNTVESENQADEQVSYSNHCEEHVDPTVASSIKDASSVKAALTLLKAQNFEEHVNERNYTSCEYVVFDKEDLVELGDTDFCSDIADFDTLESGLSDSELLLNGEVSFLTNGDQKAPEKEESIAQDSSSDISDSECFQKQDILDDTVTIDHEINSDEVKLKSGYHEKFEERSKEEFDVSSPNVLLDNQGFKETKERGTHGEATGCDDLGSAVCESELHVNGENIASYLKGDQQQYEDDSNACFSSSNPSESQCFEKQDILDDTGISFVEVISISDDLAKIEDQSKEVKFVFKNGYEGLCITNRIDNCSFILIRKLMFQVQMFRVINKISREYVVLKSYQYHMILKRLKTRKIDVSSPNVSSPNVSCDKQEFKGISSVEVMSISDDLEKIEDKCKEKVDVSSPNVLCDKQEIKEVEERDANEEVTVADEVSSSLEEVQPEQEEKEVNVPTTSSDLEVSKSIRNTQFIVSTEARDQQVVLPEDVISSQSCNASKLLEVPSVQPSQPLTSTKPKRRLRPASSVMLKNINISDFDDATTMPKQRTGKRGENEDGRKITPGGISLLRILKQNLHH